MQYTLNMIVNAAFATLDITINAAMATAEEAEQKHIDRLMQQLRQALMHLTRQ